jgi:hypothetical protein
MKPKGDGNSGTEVPEVSNSSERNLTSPDAIPRGKLKSPKHLRSAAWLIPTLLAFIVLGYSLARIPLQVQIVGGNLEIVRSADTVQAIEPSATPTKVPSIEAAATTAGRASPEALPTFTPTEPTATSIPEPILILEAEGDSTTGESSDRTVTWMLPPDADIIHWRRSADALASYLRRQAGLSTAVYIAPNIQSVLDALCSGASQVSLMSFADYLIASQEGCGEATLAGVQFGATTFAGQILAREGSGIFLIADLAGKRFCRPDPTSAAGWRVPRLIMLVQGIDPLRELARSAGLTISEAYRSAPED